MIAYNYQIDPPAPFLEITIANKLQPRKRITISALLDTGSDFTAIPNEWVNKLQLYPIGQIYIEDVHLQTISVFTFAIQLTLVDITITRLEVISTDMEHAILGRDVLNRFYLQLNGPDFTFDLSSTPPLQKE